MKTLIISLLSLIIATHCFSQQVFTLEGTITDENSKPVKDAYVHLLNTNNTTSTNHDGSFILKNISAGTYSIEVSAAGYAALIKQAVISTGANKIAIILKPSYKQLDEIIVNSQKKEELLQKLPLSVTALKARQVEEYRLWNIRELSSIIPNFYAADPGDKRNVAAIRGIVTTSYDPAITTYIDGVNQFSLDTYIPQLFDIERIEVLRGPQGTLYGRNAMGGVVNIITKQPANYTSGFAELNLGNYGQQRIIAGIRTPVIKEKLFFGATGMYDHFNGFYQNDFTNKDFDRQTSISGNYYIKYLFGKNWTALANVKHLSNRNHGAFTLVYLDQAFNPPFHVNQNALTRMTDNTWNSSLSLDHAGSHIHFTSQTSWQHNYRYYKDPIDADLSPLDAISIINNYGKAWNKSGVFTQEFRISSPAASKGHFKWSSGIYLFHQNNPVKQTTRFGNDAGLIGMPDINFSLINSTRTKSSGAAFYGEASYKATEELELITGIRYDHEKKEQGILGEYQKDPDPNPQYAYRSDTSASASFSAISPKINIVYHWTKTNTLFVSYARGFRAGGLTPLSSDPSLPALFTYKPEYSNNFEAGIKNSFLNNTFIVNVAAFYMTLNNAQVPTLVLPDAVTITRNTGKLTSKGIEAELRALPTKGLELNYSFGYTDAKYKNLKVSQNGSEVDLKGRKQVFTPDITSMMALQYSYKLGKKQMMALVIRGEWKYLGTQYFDLANTIKQTPYSIFNTRVGLALKDIELMFWGRNLGDKKYISYAYDFGAAHLGDPLTYGLTVHVKL